MNGPSESFIFAFYEDEKQAYDLQTEVLNLCGVVDALSNYTCHSVPHIQEVMELASMLFDALRDWLCQNIGLHLGELASA